ncbi:50S ribosomal protein L11 methyltransferase [Marinobacterium sp. AK62]|uniref:Ribosomal protein L11 methyltransferase n=1 Tax=Marinobacterium alkalitolerans TaxID=1542925 RepID=A0ABS3Z9R1_9GAMM|nr:50S ribosomal protein L11 methyltransferase [Marinobacterium alkalitolerans]MBP0048407.1 50S ribosomal protein L11 methyltransferase [Marinobacterium alkalitolerans]
MPWLQIKVSIQPEQAETYEDLLLAAGCAAVTYQDAADQPIFEPDLGTTPLWNTTVVTGLFAAEHDIQETLQLLQAAQQQMDTTADTPRPEFKAEILEDKDWEREWMDHYHPMQFGKRLWVCPSWRDVPEPDAVNLMLDPGLAFGTGTHPTTALCLEWLDGQPLEELQVVDYGCGSGILGIAALLLGARHVQAVDIDPQALTATRDNLERNGLSPDQLDTWLPLQAPMVKADVLVANILAGPLAELAPTLAERVKPGGKILLSGLLSQQADELISVYSRWFDMDPPGEREGWIRLSGVRRQED